MTKNIASKIISVFCLIFISQVLSASFDCDKAQTSVDKMICSNEDLSDLDMKMAKEYKNTLDQVSEKSEVIKTQKEWLKYRRDNCKFIKCLVDAYTDRISELQAFVDRSKNAQTLKRTEKKNREYLCNKVENHYFKEKRLGDHWVTMAASRRIDEAFWEPLNINAPIRGVYMDCSTTESTELDINNDGEMEYIVRITGCLSDYYMHNLYVFSKNVPVFDKKDAIHVIGEGFFNEIDILRVGGLTGKFYLRVSEVNDKQEYVNHKIVFLNDNYEQETICELSSIKKN